MKPLSLMCTSFNEFVEPLLWSHHHLHRYHYYDYLQKSLFMAMTNASMHCAERKEFFLASDNITT